MIMDYAQNAYLSCGGDVVVRHIGTNSVIECGGRLLATEGKGVLRGGRYTAAQGVTAKTMGSEMGVDTLVSIGRDPRMKRELDELREVREALEELEGRKCENKRAIDRERDQGRVYVAAP